MKKFLIVLCIIMLIACSNPKKASKSNFKAAIQNYIAAEQSCIRDIGEFPYEIKETSFRFQNITEFMEPFVRIGFLSIEEREEEKKPFFSTALSKSKPPEMQRVIRYSLEERGAEFYTDSSFCYGSGYEVVEVNNFTEPADFIGQTISRVNFSYKVTTISDWVTEDPYFQNEYETVKAHIQSSETPINSETVLVLTENGWIHEKEFEKTLQ